LNNPPIDPSDDVNDNNIVETETSISKDFEYHKNEIIGISLPVHDSVLHA
jgi:hypothetical protein